MSKPTPRQHDSRQTEAGNAIARYTHYQGQVLAFIYDYAKLNKCPPAEADIAGYFGISPPSAHQVILKLEGQGFITRRPGQARSIQLTLPREALPDLE